MHTFQLCGTEEQLKGVMTQISLPTSTPAVQPIKANILWEFYQTVRAELAGIPLETVYHHSKRQTFRGVKPLISVMLFLFFQTVSLTD